MSRILLIDGDIVAYRAAVTSEKTTDWGEGVVSSDIDEAGAKRKVEQRIESYMNQLGADEYRVALTDANNWRKRVLPTYKANRAGAPKPALLGVLKQHLADNHGARTVKWLEGDDVLGVWSTHPAIKGEKIIVSIDKDFSSVPGLVFSPDHDRKPRTITEQAANLFHMTQTLTGDVVDGYSGCPNIGKMRAHKILDEVRDSPRLMWEVVVAAYAKKKLTEADALVQARVARILRAPEYDSKTCKVKLWNPPASPAAH